MREHAAGAKAQLSPESHPVSRSALRYDCKRNRPHAAGGLLQNSLSSFVIGCTRVLLQTPYAGSLYGTTWVQLLAHPNAFAIRSEAQDSGGARHQAVCLRCLRKPDVLPGSMGTAASPMSGTVIAVRANRGTAMMREGERLCPHYD